MVYISPYTDVLEGKWIEKTNELIDQHPLTPAELVDVVLVSWTSIFESRLGGKFRIGADINPKPQIMGFLLHELIPLELSYRYKDIWRPEKDKNDKDIVHIPDVSKSIELKTSSHPSQIFGNRSYAQEQDGTRGKSKNGYYLAVNFEKFSSKRLPVISLIRFGWLDHTDWVGQKAATGQQARIISTHERTKLKTLYSSK